MIWHTMKFYLMQNTFMEIHIRGGRKRIAERAPFAFCRGAKAVGLLPNYHLVAGLNLQKHVQSIYEYSKKLEMALSEVLMLTHKSCFFS